MLRNQKAVYHTITVGGEVLKLRFSLNSMDYLERVYGDYTKALTLCTGEGAKASDIKHLIRAALLCNYPDNAQMLEYGTLDNLRPTLAEIGELFDLDTINALNVELFKIAVQSLTVEGEHGLGEQKAEQQAVELALAAIGGLSELFGRQIFTEAIRIFGRQLHEK